MRAGSDEQTDRVSRSLGTYVERRRAANRVSLSDVRRYRREGLVTDSMLPLTYLAEDEVRAIFQALGGEEAISEQERALVEDFARVGVVMRGELSRYLAGDRDAGKVVGIMAATRRSSLVALGLQRRAKELDLEDYIEAKGSS